jgi:hypothetical protein
VTQQLLDSAHIRFVPEHGRGTGVAERMAVDVFFDPCLMGVFFNQHPHGIMIEAVTARG